MSADKRKTGLCGCPRSRHCMDCGGVIPSGGELDMDEVRHVADGKPDWFTARMARRILELEELVGRVACICDPPCFQVPGHSPGHPEKPTETSND